MNGDDKLTVEGVVLAEHRGDLFTVEVEIGDAKRVVLARRSGRLYRRNIRCLPGDRVTVEVSPYDTSRGRITERERAAG